MTSTIVLTLGARQSLADILDWTLATFGPAQADSCEALTRDRLARLEDGTAHMRSCRDLTGEPRHALLRCLLVGEYVAVYREVGDMIQIIDFLHGRGDLPRSLRTLETDTKDN